MGFCGFPAKLSVVSLADSVLLPAGGEFFGKSSKTGQLKSTTVCADSTFSTEEKVKTFFTTSEKSGKCYSTAECVFPSFQAEI